MNKEEVIEEKKVKKAEVAYPLHELQSNSKELFNVNAEVVEGAFRHTKEKKLTKRQAKELITKFLKEEVK